MPNPTAAILIIGDEILSGRTRDSNMHYLAGELTKNGITLAGARVGSDDADAIIGAVNALRAAYDNVFTSGGIGPTHDDITAEAVAAVQARRFDLVLMDIKMPVMDGVAAARAIRALPGPEARLPILALTANADERDEADYVAAGMNGVAQKPIQPDALLNAIRLVLAEADADVAEAA